jgi:predicted transport protein
MAGGLVCPPTRTRERSAVAGSPQQLVRDQLEEGFSRDVRSIGHYGTGDLELRIKNSADVAKAQPLIQQSYSTG